MAIRELCVHLEWVTPIEVTDEDIVSVPQDSPIHKWCSGTRDVERGRMFISTLLCEGNGRLTTNFCSSVDYSPSDYTPRLGGHEILLEEHARVGGR